MKHPTPTEMQYRGDESDLVGQYSCRHCPKTFTKKHELSEHQSEDHLECPDCKQKAKTAGALVQHISEHDNGPFLVYNGLMFYVKWQKGHLSLAGKVVAEAGRNTVEEAKETPNDNRIEKDLVGEQRASDVSPSSFNLVNLICPGTNVLFLA